MIPEEIALLADMVQELSDTDRDAAIKIAYAMQDFLANAGFVITPKVSSI